MNILNSLVPALHGGDDDMSDEARQRRNVLYSQLRARTGLPPENIDLSGVDFEISDDDLRAQIAKEMGIKSEERIAAIDLDRVIVPSGKDARRARRRMERAEKARRARGQRLYNRQWRKVAFRDGVTESGSAKVKRQRAEKAAARLREGDVVGKVA